ncbi:hypothetical protein [Streptomyces nanshensis]|uniref:Uncharacterized protein n=1 Tax=Streptomyces nanshensis TaxID=518642 RepID=A0A1E7KTY1_9ACTN|nr:hypothetical protein [Streptomyces nanshensis]OEV07386.1 hypothetical protein AN218_29365 [Streptomyces nanshensis]
MFSIIEKALCCRANCQHRVLLVTPGQGRQVVVEVPQTPSVCGVGLVFGGGAWTEHLSSDGLLTS